MSDGEIRIYDTSTAAKLSVLLGHMVIAIDGGFRVHETETHYIDVMRMIFNWRVSRTPKVNPLTYDRGWCYYGNGLDTLMRAVMAAKNWDGADNTEPELWDKDVFTGEYRRERKSRA
jgi:hypothetical protein